MSHDLSRCFVTRGELLSFLFVCVALSSCYPGTSQDAVVRVSLPGGEERVYEFYRGDDAESPSSLAVVDFTGAADVVRFEPGKSGYYAEVRTGQWCTELEWAERSVCLVIDPEGDLFVSELSLPKGEELVDRLFSVFGPLLSADPLGINTRRIEQLWRASFGDFSIGNCLVRVSRYKGESDGSSPSELSVSFMGNYGYGVGGQGTDVPCKYFDAIRENGERWAVLNTPSGMFRLRWADGILAIDVSDRGDLLAEIFDTKGEKLTFEEAAKAGLLDNTEPVSPLREVAGLRVEELTGKPRIFLP